MTTDIKKVSRYWIHKSIQLLDAFESLFYYHQDNIRREPLCGLEILLYIYIVKNHDGVGFRKTQNSIADDLGISKSTVNKLIKSLVAKEYIYLHEKIDFFGSTYRLTEYRKSSCSKDSQVLLNFLEEKIREI